MIHYVYINLTDKRLYISSIDVSGKNIHKLMNSTDLQSAKMYCIGYVQGQNISDNMKILVLNNIEEFAGTTTFVPEFTNNQI